MRSCKPFTAPSSRDDVTESQAEMDEAASPASVLSYESALIRSEEEANVIHGLDYLSNNKFEETDQKVQTVYLKVLALYRLKRDKECLKVIQEAKSQLISSAEIEKIGDTIVKEQKEQNDKLAAAGVGIGATILVGIAAITAIIFGAKRKK
ncbi:hypothetical protein M9Y10_019188 [Tritrichomonas musculus]|uniref:Mitochondrial fission 1 protein n=1 Tax=Tritrichomonas musculus TaxID=1915356 RepID=A0ABR2HKJ6_9EUKA